MLSLISYKCASDNQLEGRGKLSGPKDFSDEEIEITTVGTKVEFFWIPLELVVIRTLLTPGHLLTDGSDDYNVCQRIIFC